MIVPVAMPGPTIGKPTDSVPVDTFVTVRVVALIEPVKEVVSPIDKFV
jgi:hypothetical protein